MAFETSVRWFNIGAWRHVGLMCGSNVLNILEDLQKEGLREEYGNLLEEIERCTQVFVETPYPYSSELFVDQTAHEQVYFFTKYFGNRKKSLRTLQVIEALRGGDQPVWFRYGNDKRGDMACWYSESLNGMALLKGFEETGDMEMFIKGYAGVMSVTANLLPDGMGFGWFHSSPRLFDHWPPRTLDNGIGMYGFFKAAKSYVIQDESFGLIGCGCNIASSNNVTRAYPKDGLKKRIMFVDDEIDIEARKGEIESVTLNRTSRSLEIHMVDSTHLVKKAEIVLKGLDNGVYEIKHGKTVEETRISKSLKLSVPINEADKIVIRKVGTCL